MDTFSATLALQGAATFEAASGSGHTLLLDSPEVTGGGNDGPCPLELLLMAVGGCAGMVTAGVLRRMHQDVSAYRVHVRGTRAESHPKVFTEIAVAHFIEGCALDAAAVRQALALAAAKYCPVVIMVAQAAKVTHTYEVKDLVTGQVGGGVLEEPAHA